MIAEQLPYPLTEEGLRIWNHIAWYLMSDSIKADLMNKKEIATV